MSAPQDPMSALTDAFDRLRVSRINFARLRLTANLQRPTGGVFATEVRGVAQPIPATYQIPYGVTFAGGNRTYAVRPSRLDVTNRTPRTISNVNDQYPPWSFQWRGLLTERRFRFAISRRQNLAATVQMDQHRLVSGIVTKLRVWMRKAHKNIIKSWLAPQGRFLFRAQYGLNRIPGISRIKKRKRK